MAYDLRLRLDNSSALADNLSPTSTPPSDWPSDTSSGRDNVIHGSNTQKDALSGRDGHHDIQGLLRTRCRASNTEPECLARLQDDWALASARTQPIDVPPASASRDIDAVPDKDTCVESRYQEASPLEDFMRNRRPSISFNPRVTLESGHHRPLAGLFPELAIDTRQRRRSTPHKLEIYPVRSPLLRSCSEAGSGIHDKGTGEPLELVLRQNSPSTAQHPSNQAFDPLLRSTICNFESAKQEPKQELIPERDASLSSESTASSMISEIQTPTDGMDILISPISAHSPFPSFPYPISLEDSSTWPKTRRQASASRSRSYNAERKSSMRQAVRQGSRISRRSTSSSISPATAFLSRFAREEAVLEEDDEGQEVGEYVLGKQVGYGGFSTVKEAFTLEGEERISRAVKIVRKQVPGREEQENERLQVEFEHEVGLWRCLGHRNILPLIEVYVTGYATYCFTKLNTGGTLFDVVRVNRQGLSRDLVRRYTYQLASAIRYLHEDARVVHRDIKLENCLIDISDPASAIDGGNVLLCDFGLAEFATSDIRQTPEPYENGVDRPPSRGSVPSEASVSVAGSLQYASPELILSPAGFLSSVVDVWAFGVVIYALLVGDLPFQHMFQPRVRVMILAGEWDCTALERAGGVEGYEEEAVEFVTRCLEMESDRRWTIGQVLKSRWLQGCQEMLEEFNGSWKL